MMKWFRKYNKHLMAGLVVILMVSFLIQDSLTKREQRRQFSDWGKLRGQMLRTDALDGPTRTRAVVDSLGLNWKQPWYGMLPSPSPQYFVSAGLTPPKQLNPDTFALLWIEAADAHIEESKDNARSFLGQMRIDERIVNRVLDSHNLKREELYAEVARYMRILRLCNVAAQSVHVTEDQVRRYVRDTQETVKVAFVAFPAERFVDEHFDPPAADVEAQFAKYRDAAKPKEESGFGYKWPQRVMLETLTMSVDDAKPGVTISEDEARQHYRQNRMSYTRVEMPATRPAASAPATSAPATSSAPASGPITRQLTFTEARSQVEDTLRAKRAQARVRDFMDQISVELSNPWNNQARGEDGYPARAAGVDAPGYMEQAALRFTNRFGVPVRYEKTALLTAEQLQTDKKWNTFFGGTERGQPLGLADAVFKVPPFFNAKDAGETALRLALYQPCDTVFMDEDMIGQQRSACVVRVIESHEAEAPKAIDEVRDKVVADLRRVKADAVAAQMAERLYAVARVTGLKAALEADPEVKKMLLPKPASTAPSAEPVGEIYAEPSPFARRGRSPFGDEPPFVMGFDGSKSAIDACFEMAASGWQSPASTQPVATQPQAPATQPSPKVRVVQIPESRSRLVVELHDFKPVREDEYETARANGQGMMQIARVVTTLHSWFDDQQIMKRVGFEPVHPAKLSSATDEE